MGIYDRDYNRDDSSYGSPGIHLGGQRSVTVNLIIFTCIIYFFQLVLGKWVTESFALMDDWYKRPWQIYQLLTYGFLHSPDDLWHILLNMFILWMFGREVEMKYGRREYLAFYLCAIVVAGLVWTLAELPNERTAAVLGASGGISAVLILYALNFPHRTVLFMMVACILIGLDVMGSMDRSGTIACTAHLGGAMFAFVYFRWKLRLERWLPSGSWRPRFGRGPKLRVRSPDEVDQEQDEKDDDRVDDILRKIREHGQDSLTWRERRILEKASREYQKKRK
jgi:rhomboid family protein